MQQRIKILPGGSEREGRRTGERAKAEMELCGQMTEMENFNRKSKQTEWKLTADATNEIRLEAVVLACCRRLTKNETLRWHSHSHTPWSHENGTFASFYRNKMREWCCMARPSTGYVWYTQVTGSHDDIADDVDNDAVAITMETRTQKGNTPRSHERDWASGCGAHTLSVHWIHKRKFLLNVRTVKERSARFAQTNGDSILTRTPTRNTPSPEWEKKNEMTISEHFPRPGRRFCRTKQCER